MDAVHQVVAGAVGSLVTNIVVTPLDVLKTRLQAETRTRQSDSQFRLWRTFRAILSEGGPTALWRGLSPTLVISIPSTAVYYAAYEQMRDWLRNYGVQSAAPMISGATARVLVVFTSAPFELVRTNLQAQGSRIDGVRVSFSGPVEVARHVLGQSGLRGLFVGMTPTLLRDVPFSALYWFLFEDIRMRALHRLRPALDSGPTVTRGAELWASFAAGATAGTAAAVLTHPADVVKTAMQVRTAPATSSPSPSSRAPSPYLRAGGMWNTVQMLRRQDGWRWLGRGLVPRAARVAPACAVMILTYEGVKLLLRRPAG